MEDVVSQMEDVIMIDLPISRNNPKIHIVTNSEIPRNKHRYLDILISIMKFWNLVA